MDTTLTTGTDEPWAGWVFSECNLVGHPPEPHWHPPVGNTPHAPVADAVAELARAVGALDTPDGQDFAHRLAADMFAALRADPAAARAVLEWIKQHGVHSPFCAYLNPGNDCDCGLRAVLDSGGEQTDPPRVWRSPCGLYEVVAVPPLRCPSCGSRAWATQGDEARPPVLGFYDGDVNELIGDGERRGTPDAD